MHITEALINSTHFYEVFSPFFQDKNTDDYREFFDKPGKQHYRLLAYLSSLYSNSTIIDVGTHKGSSALALSYNPTNTIYSFDIVNNVSIKNHVQIKYNYDDLFDPATFAKWYPIIEKAPFIFLDVDPHNGKMESNFVNLCKEHGYQGFIVCDDIWYFKEMRDHFWNKMPCKYDLTSVGHWSGTGIISFNKNIEFNKHNNDDWTLVTAYFDLTKCPDASISIKNRPDSYYLQHSNATLSLPYNMVIYCDQASLPKIREIRPSYLDAKTTYIIREFDDFSIAGQTFDVYRRKIQENRRKTPYNFDDRNTASYYLFCMSRYVMLQETIAKNHYGSTHFCWINFCIERMGYQNLVRLDEALSLHRDRFSTCYIDYIPESLINDTATYYQWGRCSMCSGFFTGATTYMYTVCGLIISQFLTYLEAGYGHADEQLYSPVFFKHPDLFEHYYGDYTEMITNYAFIYERPEPPIYNFIRNSFDNKDYARCIKACEFLIKRSKCNIDPNAKQMLFHYYFNAHHLG
jgi:hypothetical protein